MNTLFDTAPFHDPCAAKAALAMFRFDDGESHWFFATSEEEARRLFREHRREIGCPLHYAEEAGGEDEVRMVEEPLTSVLDFWEDTPSNVVATKPVAEWIEAADGPGFWGSTEF
jgi:hypothetical protein